jgi:DNA invertase Pin-like site-specific DNA recombinase
VWFARLLDRIEGNGTHTVVVEDASRFARDLAVQELGTTLLAKRSVRLLTASATTRPTAMTSAGK